MTESQIFPEDSNDQQDDQVVHPRHPEREHAAHHDDLTMMDAETMQNSENTAWEKKAVDAIPHGLFHSECNTLAKMREDYVSLRDDTTGWAAKAALPAALALAALARGRWRASGTVASVALYAGVRVASNLIAMKLARHEMWTHAHLDSTIAHNKAMLRKTKLLTTGEIPPGVLDQFRNMGWDIPEGE